MSAPALQTVEEELLAEMREPVGAALAIDPDQLSLEPMVAPKGVADESVKLMAGRGRAEPRAVVLCSPASAPEIVLRGSEGARRAAAALGPRLGQHVLVPLFEGWVAGRSYAVLARMEPLRLDPPAWYWQRRRLRPVLLRFLRDAASATRAESGDPAEAYVAALRAAAELRELPAPIRALADDSLERIRQGRWRPVHTLMHGDLWPGNVLIAPRSGSGGQPWPERFVLTDWPGVAVRGFPVYDLVRLAASLRMPDRSLGREIVAHAAILGGPPADGLRYLVAALGHVARHLEHFPVERYVALATICHDRVLAALR